LSQKVRRKKAGREAQKHNGEDKKKSGGTKKIIRDKKEVKT